MSSQKPAANDPADGDRIDTNDTLELKDVRQTFEHGKPIKLFNKTQNRQIEVSCTFSIRQIRMILKGSLINVVREKYKKT